MSIREGREEKELRLEAMRLAVVITEPSGAAALAVEANFKVIFRLLQGKAQPVDTADTTPETS